MATYGPHDDANPVDPKTVATKLRPREVKAIKTLSRRWKKTRSSVIRTLIEERIEQMRGEDASL